MKALHGFRRNTVVPVVALAVGLTGVVTAASPSHVASAATAGALAADSGSWGPVLDWGVQAKHMVMLPTGRVLVWSTGDNARVWDPATGQFSLTPATFGDLHCAGQATLADGRIVVVGGQTGSPHNGTNITALFDPATETWSRGADMHDLRWYAAATTLPDGRLLTTSGDAPDGSRSAVPEVYDPARNTWTRLTTASRSQPLYPLMFVLPNGKVFDSGPKNTTATLDLSGTPAWAAGPTSAYSTSGYSESAVMYKPGSVLRAGGGDPAQAATSLIDMTQASPTWRLGEPMAFPRRRMNLTLLADGTVLAVGGTRAADNASQAVLPGEIWDPATGHWSTVAAMSEERMYHSSAVLLPDGRVLSGGGEAAGRLHAQIYSPPYLSKGARPTITSAPATAAYGTSFSVQTPDAADITSVAMLRASAATHASDMNQRYVPLSFSSTAGRLNVTAPASGGVAPPGDYMLIVKNAAGVPSVASWVRVGTADSIRPGSVSGTVTDAASGAPVVGASVSSPGKAAVTGDDGRFVLAGVPAGELAVTTTAAGFATDSRTAFVTGGADTPLDVALARPGDVTGQVTSAAGAPLAGAAVGYPGGTAVTDAAGTYTITGLAAGSHALTFGATGFKSTEQTVVVRAGETVTLNVSLTAAVTYITGEVRSAASDQVLPDATVAVEPGGLSGHADAFGRYRIEAPPGTYRVTASAPGHVDSSGSAVVSSGTYATLDFALAASSGSGSVTVRLTADSYVKSSSPTKNYGRETSLRIRGTTATDTTAYAAHLSFDITGLTGRTVRQATLRLFVTDGGPTGGTLYRTTAPWTETGLTWNNAPPTVGPPLRTLGVVNAGQWVDVALPAGTITADGALGLSLSGNGTNSVYATSREGANAPQLVLDLEPETGDPVAPVASFTVSPTSGPAPLTVTAVDGSSGSPTLWRWDFGDGTTSTSAAPPSHTYAEAGSYTVTLTVSNAVGSSTTTRTVTATVPTPPPTGGRIKDITFDAGLLDPVHGVDATSGPVTLESAMPVAGTSSASIAAAAYVQEGFPAEPDLFLRFSLRLRSLPTGSPRIALITNGGTTQANLVLLPSGRLRLRVGSSTVGIDSPALAVGTVYYVGLHQRRGSGTDALAEASVSTAAAAVAPFAATTKGSWTTAADRVRLGGTNGAALNALVDDILLDSAAMPTAPDAARARRAGVAIVTGLAGAPGMAWMAQDADMTGMDHTGMTGMDHTGMTGMDHSKTGPPAGHTH